MVDSGVEQSGELGGLITHRSPVQIRSPLPMVNICQILLTRYGS